MRIFHGSNMVVVTPKTDVGRKNLDFGCGFYVTNLSDQALDQLRFKTPNHQICIISQSVVDSFLRFVQHKILEERL